MGPPKTNCLRSLLYPEIFMMRQLKDLTDSQLKDAYYTVYREAFPPAELKPLSSMRRMTEDGVYRNLALFDGDEPVAFANLWLDGDHILIDYLCVPAVRRGGGLGAGLLSCLRELYSPETVFIVETEAPTGAPEKDALINRRLAFYERCGAIPLGYETAIFGVHYKTVVWSPLPPDEAEIQKRHAAFYRRRLGPDLYAEAIHIPYHRGDTIRFFEEWKEDYAHTFR